MVTALREVTEETGYCPRIGPHLTSVRYRITSGCRVSNKVVTYWAMRCAGGSFLASREVDAMEWLPLGRGSLAPELSIRPLCSAHVRAHPPGHRAAAADQARGDCCASARPKKRPEEQRLNRSGRDQAASLVPVLAGLGITDLLSADLPSCVDMLAPFAATTGLTVRREAQLTRDGFAGNERVVAARVRDEASSSQALVVCGGQRVITGLVSALGDGFGVRPPRETTIKKGGWWLLHHRAGVISAYERHDPRPDRELPPNCDPPSLPETESLIWPPVFAP